MKKKYELWNAFQIKSETLYFSVFVSLHVMLTLDDRPRMWSTRVIHDRYGKAAIVTNRLIRNSY